MARFVENITYETAGSISIGRWRRATGSNSAPWCSSRAGISRIAFTYSGRNVSHWLTALLVAVATDGRHDPD